MAIPDGHVLALHVIEIADPDENAEPWHGPPSLPSLFDPAAPRPTGIRVVVPYADPGKLTSVSQLHSHDYAPTGLAEETRAVGEWVGAEFVDVSEPGAYFDLFCTLWSRGEAFVLLEQDMAPSADDLVALWACPDEWCAARYPYPLPGALDGEIGLIWGLGCTKFSAALIQRFPELPAWLATECPGREWHELDRLIEQFLCDHGGLPGPCTNHAPVNHLRVPVMLLLG